MLQVMVSPGLERMCQQQQFRLAKELARELQPRGGSLEESAGQADDGMTGAIRECQIGSDEEVESGHGFVHLFHDAHAIPVRLDVLDSRNEAGRANLGGAATLFWAMFHFAEPAAASQIVERRGRFRVSDEVDGLD